MITSIAIKKTNNIKDMSKEETKERIEEENRFQKTITALNNTCFDFDSYKNNMSKPNEIKQEVVNVKKPLARKATKKASNKKLSGKAAKKASESSSFTDSSKTISTIETESTQKGIKRKACTPALNSKKITEVVVVNHPTRNRRERKAARKQTVDSYCESDDDTTLNKDRKIPCPHCHREFSAQGLGGHKAKAHPGLNIEYQQKQEIRKKNSDKLQILRLAQFQYKFDCNKMDADNSNLNRSKVVKYKKYFSDKVEEIMIAKNVKKAEAIKEIQDYQERLRMNIEERN